MKRLVFKAADVAALKEVGEALNQAPLSGWRISVLSKQAAEVAAAGMRDMSILRSSDMLAYGWRGGFWGGLISALVILLAAGLFGVGEGLAQEVLMVALPLTCIFFGAWEGAFVGMTRMNPGLQPFADSIARGEFVVVIDVGPENERLAKKLMGRCGAQQLAEYYSRGWTPRGPLRPQERSL